MNRKRRLCMYCEEPGRKITGEHVIPSTIGGQDKIKSVCNSCNNGELSRLDNELCSRSPVALIAASELADQRTIHELWLIDERQDNLLVEGQWKPALDTYLTYPQLILEGERAQLRADGTEMNQVGERRFQELFLKAAYYAYDLYLVGKRKLFFEQVDTRFFPKDNRLPPRIFSRTRLTELRVGDSFILRYVEEEDKRQLLDKLSSRRLFKRQNRAEHYISGNTLAFQVMFNPAIISRAFMKIGLNALAWACEKTEVTRQNFSDPCDLVTGRATDDIRMQQTSGFVRAVDLVGMSCREEEHRIWIMRDGQIWNIKIAFFGGRIGGITSFSGPSAEDWNFIDIGCPINEPMQLVNRSALYVDGKVPVCFGDLREVAPSIEAFNRREGHFFKKLNKRKAKAC